MKKVGLRLAAIAVIGCMAGGVQAADPQPDFSKVDPAWAAEHLDRSLRESDMGSAWEAMGAVFPEDYARLTRDMATALIGRGEWKGLSQQFMQDHLGGNLEAARHAPAPAQLKYQQRKAALLEYLSATNPAACAYLGTGFGDAASLTELNAEGTRRYADLIAEVVRTIGAGRDFPTDFAPLSPADGSRILSIMVAQGTPEVAARKILLGEVGRTPAEQCRAGVLKHKAVAASPADIVAKVAFN